MSRSGYWVIRTYVSGNVGEKIKYFIPGNRSRSKRAYKSDIRKQEQNAKSSERALARLINANFSAGDYLVGLDYSGESLCFVEQNIQKTSSALKKGARTHTRVYNIGNPDNEEYMQALRESAEHELRLVLRRVKRVCEKEGIVLRYIAVTSDMDGKTGESVRIHHHLIINKEAAELFRNKWYLGGVYAEPLRVQEDYTEIARYLIEQVRRIPDNKKYISSRNLERPIPKDRVVSSGAEVRVPKGAKLIYRSEYNEHKPQYLRYYIGGGMEDCQGHLSICGGVP